MSESNRRAVAIVSAALVLAVASAAAWCGSTLSDAKQAAADAAADTADCRRLADQVAAARRAPASGGPATDDLGPRLERALAAADVDAEALARVAPQPPRPIAGTGLARRSTQVELRLVTVRQALSFVSALVADGPAGVTLDSFRLTTPAADAGAPPGGDDDWDVELSVSQVTQAAGGRAH